ncbi:5223_t:CDS:2 [Rhizophagus irregularis]|nr:unnamed protein product [Rhizophagus irregularis]CAG8624504.1 5223_t:CDS:2 [Rhizophagus irregularis]
MKKQTRRNNLKAAHRKEEQRLKAEQKLKKQQDHKLDPAYIQQKKEMGANNQPQPACATSPQHSHNIHHQNNSDTNTD